MAKFYAAQSPRGFANEVYVYAFNTKSLRDLWVGEHCNDGDVNSAYCGAYVVNAATAKRLAGVAHYAAAGRIVYDFKDPK